MMRKIPLWGFTLFTALVMFGACKEPPPANSIWKYNGTANNTITLETGSLTYASIRTKKLKTVSIRMVKSPSEDIRKKTEKTLGPDERILAWIIAAEDPSKVYGTIYCSIEKTPEGKIAKDIPPEKLMIHESSEILADLNVRPPYVYIRQ